MYIFVNKIGQTSVSAVVDTIYKLDSEMLLKI